MFATRTMTINIVRGLGGGMYQGRKVTEERSPGDLVSVTSIRSDDIRVVSTANLAAAAAANSSMVASDNDVASFGTQANFPTMQFDDDDDEEEEEEDEEDEAVVSEAGTQADFRPIEIDDDEEGEEEEESSSRGNREDSSQRRSGRVRKAKSFDTPFTPFLDA